VTRLVVDPGVFVSALIGRPGSPPDLVLQAWIDDRAAIVSGDRDLLESGLADPPVWTPRLCADRLAEFE
jgi:hypothetical protein